MIPINGQGISEINFKYIRDLVREKAAIVLDSGKESLVEARLMHLCRENGFEHIDQFVGSLRIQPFGTLHRRVIDAVATSETLFFRDVIPFDALTATIFPDLIRARERERQLNIWSAACAAGQEPYSVAMLIREHFPLLLGWDLKIYASDISGTALEQARAGVYNQIEINRGLPAPLLVKYFTRTMDKWRINDNVRCMVEFMNMNLAAPWPFLPKMDLVLMRNVLIYFDIETKKKVLERVSSRMHPDSLLFLGNCETTLNISPAFELRQIGKMVCYQLKTQSKPRSPGGRHASTDH